MLVIVLFIHMCYIAVRLEKETYACAIVNTKCNKNI